MAHQCRPWRPCRPSLHLSQRRLHAHTPAPCAGLPCVGAVTTGHAQIPTAPLTPRPLHSHTTDGSAQSALGKQTQHRPKKRTAGKAGLPKATQRMSAQRRYLLCQLHQLGPWHLPHPAPCSSRALLLPTLRCLPSERPQRRRRLRAAAHSQSGASRTAWQSVSHRSVAGGGCTPQIPHPHLLRLGRLELLQMPAHSRISAAHRPTCATQQHDRCYSETTHTQRNTTRPRDAPKHGSASAHSLPPRVVRHKPPCDACGACAVSVCRFGEDVQMCDRRARTGVALLALVAFRAGRTRRT